MDVEAADVHEAVDVEAADVHEAVDMIAVDVVAATVAAAYAAHSPSPTWEATAAAAAAAPPLGMCLLRCH